MPAYTYTMSNDPTAPRTSTDRPTAPAAPTAFSQDGFPTEVLPTAAPVPTRRPILCAAQPERSPFADWRDQMPTAAPADRATAPAGRLAQRRERRARRAAGTAFPRVSTHRKPTSGREALRTAPVGTKVLRHLRAALAGLALAAAILTGMQLLALDGISSARQAALAQRDATATTTEQAPAQPSQPDWVTRDTGVAYDRTDPTASPLSLPSCTTSPDTPTPCLAWKSADSRHAVILEEDASLTALVRR